MPNLLANIELTTSQSAPASWADVLGLSATVSVASVDSTILLVANVPIADSFSKTAEFQFALGGTREGPTVKIHKHDAPGAGSDLAGFVYAFTGLSGSQTFSLQWQRLFGIPTLDTGRKRTFQIIEILPDDEMEILAEIESVAAGADSPATYGDVPALNSGSVDVQSGSIILLSASVPHSGQDAVERNADFSFAVGGTPEGPEATAWVVQIDQSNALNGFTWAKTGLSGSQTFSIQWQDTGGKNAEIDTSKTRTLQVLEIRAASNFPQVEATATSVSSSSVTTHTIDTPAGVQSGDLLIAFIAMENDGSDPQYSGWSDGFTEIKDKLSGGTAGANVGVAYKVSDGTEGANITVDSVDAERAAHCMYRISNFDPAIAPEITAGASGLSAAPDPDSLTPAGGAKDFMYMVLAAFEKDDETITAFPTNYGSNQVNNSMFSGATIGVATRELNAATEDPGAFTMSGAEEWQAFTLAVHPFIPPTAAVTGTATASIDEEDVLDGGKTIILTLTGDTFVAAGAPFDGIRQDIIDGLNSAQNAFRGWNNEVRDKQLVAGVVRTSDTVVTITLDAQSLYNIGESDQETINVTIPASALVTSGVGIAAAPSFTVDGVAPFAVVSGTADGSDETDIVAGGRTIILTLHQDSWSTPFGTSNKQAIIDGLNSAQSELTGWNNEVRDKQGTAGVVLTDAVTVTITLDAQAGYDITAPEVITPTIPTSVLSGGGPPIVATPDIDIAVGPATAAITGTVTPASTEAQIVAGGRTIIITLDNDTWVASGAAFNAIRQDIIDGITSAQSELTGWNNEVRDNLPVGQVTRTSDTVVTVSLQPETGYNITDFEEITVTVPASAVVGAAPIVATPTFTIFEVPVALISGTIVPSARDSEIVAGGKTIIITLIDDEWLAAGVPFDDSRQDIIQGLDSDITGIQAPNGWNQEVRDNLADGQVVRTSDTVVTITLTAFPAYDPNGFVETITVTVPGSALDQTPNDITGVPTFQVTLGATGRRGRRGGRHAEDTFDVNEPTVETFEVNKFE